jgi:hypothetical protein
MKTPRVGSKVATLLACLVSLGGALVCEARRPAGDAARRSAVASAVCPAGAFAIANSSNAEESISAAFDGTNFLVGIQGDQTDHTDVTAQLVSPLGALVGPRISTGRTGGVPYVAFDGTNYLMAWSNEAPNHIDPIYGQFVSPSGSLVGGPFLISQGIDNLNPEGIAFDGTDYLVIYAMGTPGGAGSGSTGPLAARFVTKAGAVGSEIALTSATRSGYVAGIAFNGTSFLVTWWRDLTPTQAVIEARTVSRTGDLGGVATISSSVSPNGSATSVASDGMNFLVVWDPDMGPGPTESISRETHGRLVTGTGGLLGSEFTIAGAPGKNQYPFASYGGGSYLVTWTDVTDWSNTNIWARFVSPTGTLTGLAFAITTCPGVQLGSPAVFGGGKFLVVWVEGIDPTTFSGGHVFGTFVSPLQSTLAITTSSALPAGAIGVPYSLQLAATGGTGSLSWSVIGGALPGGLSLGAAGLLSGTPTAAGSTSFTVQVADSAGISVQGAFTLSISGCNAPAITSQPQGASIQTGQTATLSVRASGPPPLAFQWYQGSSGDTANLVGSNAAAFTTPPLSVTTSYWVRVSNACDHADSATATVTVGPTYAFSTWVPVVVTSSGLAGSQWRSSVGILNTASSTANVEMRLYVGGFVLRNTTTVAAGAQSILGDVVAQLAPGFSGAGALQVVSDQAVRVTSRTYNLVAPDASCYPNGTQGSSYPAFAAADGLIAGQSGYLAALVENTAFRTNIGLVNAGDSDATVLVELFDGAGTKLAEYTVHLAPGDWRAETQPFSSRGGQTAMDRGYAKITVQTGSGVLAFGSLVDNLTNDPTTVMTQR